MSLDGDMNAGCSMFQWLTGAPEPAGALEASVWWRHKPGRRSGANRRASTAASSLESLQAQRVPAEEAARLVAVLPSYMYLLALALALALTHCAGPTVRHRPGACCWETPKDR